MRELRTEEDKVNLFAPRTVTIVALSRACRVPDSGFVQVEIPCKELEQLVGYRIVSVSARFIGWGEYPPDYCAAVECDEFRCVLSAFPAGDDGFLLEGSTGIFAGLDLCDARPTAFLSDTRDGDDGWMEQCQLIVTAARPGCFGKPEMRLLDVLPSAVVSCGKESRVLEPHEAMVKPSRKRGVDKRNEQRAGF